MEKKQTSSVRVATAFATLLSVGALFACFTVAPMIYTEVQNIWREIDLEMEEFKVKKLAIPFYLI